MSTQSSSNQISLHLPNLEKSLQFRQEEESESDNLFHDHIQGEDENVEDVQMADHLRSMEERIRISIIGIEDAIVVPAILAAGGNLMSKNTQEALTIIENKAKVRTCRNKPQISSSGGSLIQNDAITALTKQVEALVHHIFSMQEAYNQNHKTTIQLMQTQLGQLEEAFQERPLDVLPNDTETYPKKNLPIPCPSRLQNDKFQALEKPMGRVDHFVYRIDIVDSLCDKFPIENNSLSGNSTPSSNYVVESLFPLPTPFGDSDHLLEETDTLLSHFDNSSPDGSTTTHYDFSLPEYDSFIFDLSIDLFLPADRSVSHHEEFADELAHIISPSKYDRFYFDLEIVPGEFTRVLKENIFDLSTKGLTSIELNDSSLLLSDCDSSLSMEFSEIDPLVSIPSGNEDIVFDPGIIIIKGVQSQRFKIPLKFFSTISFESDPLFLTDSPKIDTLTSFPFGNENKICNPGILISKDFTLYILWDYLIRILKLSKSIKNLKARWRFSHSSSSSILEGTSLL
ncbi:hypothetical protein Tco_0089191 [Tanacetum coccineum]